MRLCAPRGWGFLVALAASTGPAMAAPVSGAGEAAPASRDASAPTPSPPPGAEHADDERLLGPLAIGGFVGAGFPRPLSIEGFVKVEKVVGFGVEYSVLPKMSLGGTETTLYAVAADARVFPLEDGFFVGFGLGHQHLSAVGSVSLPSPYTATPEQITGDTWFLNPRIGFLSTFAWGGTIGIDAGVQLPLNGTVATTIPSTVSGSQGAIDLAHYFSKGVVPTVNLLRLGMML